MNAVRFSIFSLLTGSPFIDVGRKKDFSVTYYLLWQGD
jgi:hypothetical protein